MWPRNEERRQETAILRNHMAYTVYTIYTIPSSRISSTEKFPLFFLSHVFWGLFPDANIKIIESKTLFNLKLKDFFLNTLSDNYKYNRLLCPHCSVSDPEQGFSPIRIRVLEIRIRP